MLVLSLPVGEGGFCSAACVRRHVLVQLFCGHFSDNLKIIATEGFSLQNVSLVSQEWHIKTLLR